MSLVRFWIEVNLAASVINVVICQNTNVPGPFSTTTDLPTTTVDMTSATTTTSPTTTIIITTSTDAPTTTMAVSTTTESMPPVNSYGLRFAFGELVRDIKLAGVDDGCSPDIILDYDIPYKDITFRRMMVCVNGLVCFKKRYNGYSIPRNGETIKDTPGLNCLAIFMSDLDTTKTGQIWYHLYDTTEDQSVQTSAVMKEVSDMVSKVYQEVFTPVMCMKATWDKVPRHLQTIPYTFQLIFASDGINSFTFYMYEYNERTEQSIGKQFIGLITNSSANGYSDSTDGSYLRRPDIRLILGDFVGATSYKLTNKRQPISTRLQCKLWHRSEMPNKFFYDTLLERMPLCPCTDTWLSFDPFFQFVPWYWRTYPIYTTYMIPSFIFGPYVKTCSYNTYTGSFIGSGNNVGAFFRYNSWSWSWSRFGSTSFNDDFYYRSLCCQYEDLCHKYYEVRPPVQRCYWSLPFFFAFGMGDPHITNFDRRSYIFNGLGEYLLTKSNKAKFEMQCRTARATKSDGTASNATIFTAFAAQGNGTYLQVELNRNQTQMLIYAGASKIDGDFADYTLLYNENGDNFSISLDGLQLSRINRTLKATFTSIGVLVNISLGVRLLQISLSLHESYRNNTVGLLGNFNGNDSDDFIPRGSTESLTNPTERTIFHEFGQTWMTYANESIFKYDNGWSHSSFSFPDRVPPFLDEANQTKVAYAEEKCGVENIRCVFDLVFTENEELALATKETEVQSINAIALGANTVPELNITSGANSIDGNYYVYVEVGKPYNVSLYGTDKEGPVTFELLVTNDTYKPMLVIGTNGTATLTITLPSLDPVSISIVSIDSTGISSRSIDLITVVCDGCSIHGNCTFTNFRERTAVSKNFRIASCVCEVYWEGDNCSTDANGCANGPCSIGQICTDTPADAHKANYSLGAYHCSACPIGYTNDGGKCVDINECSPNSPCTLGTCENTEGSFKCVCSNGYRLGLIATTCDDINECDDSTSGCAQLCENVKGSYECRCYAGYQLDSVTKKRCLEDDVNMPDACRTENCSTTHGCRTDNGFAECFCNSGFELQLNNNTCSDVDECQTSSKTVCSQTCVNQIGSYRCGCYPGYMVDPEDPTTCKACMFPNYGENCTSKCSCAQGAERCDFVRGCICLPGWKNTSCDTDINECLTPNVCGDENKVCTNNVGSYSCDCRSGYTLNSSGSCIDIDECADVTLNTCRQICTNTNGGFVCACRPGYDINTNDTTNCEDTNECEMGISNCQQLCVNTPGTYICQCYPGYVLLDDRKQCLSQDDVCKSFHNKTCSDICIIENSQPTCLCNRGYKLSSDGQTCIDINECLNETLNQCTVKESCMNSNGSYFCLCNDGFQLQNNKRQCIKCDSFHYGANCANECNCGVGASECNPIFGCICKEGWSGVKCDVDKDECGTVQSPCSGANTMCINNPGSYQCTCGNGFEKNSTSNNCEDIDECSSSMLNMCEQVCTNTVGSFQCSCNSGFIRAGNLCNDIDECSGINKCQQVCSNSIGSYRCYCETGFTLNANKMSCDPITPCSSPACGSNAYCTSINSNDTCICEKGFEFVTNSSTNCSDIRECSFKPPRCSQACTEESGSYACSCSLTGFKLDVDNSTCIECEEGQYGDDCLATCNCSYAKNNTKSCNKVNGFCQCNPGWNGTTCSDNINECVPQATPCPPNSTCFDTQGSFNCICSEGFFKTNIGTCEACNSFHYGMECAQKCSCIASNTANCDNRNGSCTCFSGWEGVNCSLNKNECDITPGICNDTLKTCNDTDGSYTCSCIEGYTNDGDVCVDNNECLLGQHNCTQKCVNKPGTYICDCNQGFSAIGSNCTDIDECIGTNHGCGQNCTNTLGSYVCSCGLGYKLNADNKTCDDIDECSDGTANCVQQCVNIPGTFNCTCKPGYSGSYNNCIDINECLGNPGCGQNCNNTLGSYVCSCGLGYTLNADNKTCDACEEGKYGNDCLATCNCSYANNNTKACNKVSGFCQCNPGWNGTSCSDNINECFTLAAPCPQNSACVDTPGSFNCVCSQGFIKTNSGTCEVCDDFHYGMDCSQNCSCAVANTASCDKTNGACTCLSGWEGSTCSSNKDECNITPAICNDTLKICIDTLGSYNCNCIEGYTKQVTGICTDINECLLGTHTCTQKCDNTPGSFKCSCNLGYSGTDNNCTDINECLENPGCGQNCTNTLGSYVCSCNLGYKLIADNKTCDAIVACDTNSCGPYTTCAKINNTDTCTCLKGYTFVNGSSTNCTDIKECSFTPSPCGQVCTELNGSYACSCNQTGFKLDVNNSTCIECTAGMFGDGCLQNCTCTYVNNNTKACNKANGSCECNLGWSGTNCNTDIDECSTTLTSCPLNSACINTQGSYTCYCSQGFSKSLNGMCVDKDECTDGTNNCEQKCINQPGTFMCACDNGYLLMGNHCTVCSNNSYGANCTSQCNCIADNAENSTQTCNTVNGTCKCKTTWTGSRCDVDVNECAANTTLCKDVANQGCDNLPGSYQCSCYVGYVPQVNLCVPTTVTTTTTPVPVGRHGIVMFLKLDLTVLEDLNVYATNEKYKNETKRALRNFFKIHLNDNIMDIIIIAVTRGSINVNFTTIISDTDTSRQQFSQAVYSLSNGSAVTIFNNKTTAQYIVVGGTSVQNNASEVSIKCMAYTVAKGVCQTNEECVLDPVNGAPVCQLVKTTDNLPLILGLSIGIPLFVIAIFICIAVTIYCKNVRRKFSSSEVNRSPYRTGYNNVVFPPIVKKVSSVNSSNPFASLKDMSECSTTISSQSSESNNGTRWRKLRNDVPAFMAEEDCGHNEEFAGQFSWHFLSKYLKPHQSYQIRRPIVSRDPQIP